MPLRRGWTLGITRSRLYWTSVPPAVIVAQQEARPHVRHHHAHHAAAHHRQHYVYHRRHRAPAPASVRAPQDPISSFFAGLTGGVTAGVSSASSSLVSIARRDTGAVARQLGLPARLWCADWVNRVLRHAGMRGTGSRAALSFESYGHRVRGPVVGAIATMSRRGGGHVGIVTGTTASGDPIIISGNHAGAVREAVYAASRIRSYVIPN